MSFLTLNGLDIPVRNDSASKQLVEIGNHSRAFDGTFRRTRQSTKGEYQFELVPQAPADAHAYVGLIQGDGHVWEFSTFYSSKGLIYSAFVGTVANTSGTLRLSGSSVASSISYQPGVVTGAGWTVVARRSTDGGSTWHHHIIAMPPGGVIPVRYLDGVLDGGATSWLTVSAPTLTLSDTAATAVRYDQLIFYPFAIPAGWVATIYASAGSAWPAIPVLSAAGDAMPRTMSVQGSVTGIKYTHRVVDGSFVAAQGVSFSLMEV